MRVICDRGALLDALNMVGPVVITRTPKPVLACVKLSAQDGGLTLAATDLEAAVRVTINQVEVSEPGEVLVLADKLNQIVRESVDPTLTLDTEDDAIHIRGQDAHFKVLGYPVGEFPTLPELTGKGDFEISATDLAVLINQTVFATARENSRYAINGVLFELEGNKITVVATDGRRLAMSKGSCKSVNGDGSTLVIIPTRTLGILNRVLDTADKPVKIKLTDNQVIFATESATLSSNLVEGNFPPYHDVIPRDGDKKATLNTDLLASAVRRAALLTNEESKGVRLSFGEKGLKLSSRAPEMGEAEIDVEMPKYEGDAVDIGFNPSFILDALKVVQSDEIQFDLKASNKPGVLRTGPNFLYVVMPVNL
ncbi:MAG: DNA polymerase III subunit beta [Phycisphaerae bacterium]|nr:DNA polymerase III subunit beta [Phycisphaerae bacterium]